MKKIISIVLCLTPIIAVADTSAIKEANYTVSSAYIDKEFSNSLFLSGTARFPIFAYTGVAINTSFEKTDYKKLDGDATEKSIGAGIFIRKYDLGNIGVNYTVNDLDVKSSNISSTDNTGSNITSLDGSLYLGRFDLGYSRSERINTFPMFDDVKFNSSTISLDYYATDNLALTVSGFGLDQDKGYPKLTISANYQPKIFNNAVSTKLSFSDNQDSDNSKSTVISISYHFDTKVSLIDRIRKY